MNPKDVAKTTFITHRDRIRIHGHTLWFGQRGSNLPKGHDKIFAAQLGQNMESHVDDMITKSKNTETHIGDLPECFETLHKHNMKLNPDKCAMALASSKFLGF